MANYDGSERHPHDHRTLLAIGGTAGAADTYQRLLQQHPTPAYRVIEEVYDGPVLARCQSQPIDAILLTCCGPDASKFAMLRHLHARLGHDCPPTVALGDNDAALAVQAVRAGAVDYLVRDRLTATQLHQALEAALCPCSRQAYAATARQLDRERFLAVGSDLQAIVGGDGHFRWVSPTFERVLGWTTAAMTSRPWLEFVHPDDRSLSVLESERLLTGGEVLSFENRYRHSDGSYRWLLWRCQMDLEQQVSYGTAVDITALKESEAALDDSFDELVEQSHSFDAMLSTISDFVYLFDRQGRYLFVNQPLLDLWGLTLADAVGKNFFDLNYPSDLAAKLQRQIEQVFVTAQPVRDEMPYTSPTGISGVYEYIFAPLLGPEGTVQSVVGSTRDVTERKLIEATLQASEERCRLIADTVPQIIWITDADGRVEFVNQQWQDYTGSLEEPATALEALVSFVHPADVATTMTAFNQALQAGGAFRAEHRVQSAAGTYRWFLVQAEPYQDPQTGKISRWFGTLVDVHDLKIAEAALRASEEKYRSLFNSMDEGFCILQVLFDRGDRPIDYRYVECNPAFERQTGLVNALGRTIRELVPTIEPFWFDIYGRVALTGDPMRFEDHAESMGRWFDVNAFRIGDPQERKVAVLFSDITDRKRREANTALLTEVSNYLSRLESADEIMQVVGAKIGEYLHITACIFCEVDKSQNEITVNYGWRDTRVPSPLRTYRLREYLSEEFDRASRAGETVVVHNTQTDGRVVGSPNYAELEIQSFVTVPFHHNGEWVYYLAITDSRPRLWHDDELNLIKEISNRIFPCLERAYAEERLRQSEERFRLLVTTSSDTLYSMSADWSEMRNLDGKNFLTPTEQPDRNWLEKYIPPEDQPQVLAVIQQAICDRGPFEFEHRVMRLDGTVGWTLSRAVPLLNEHNEIVEWFGAASDVTDRKRLLERERTARENAERANRTKDELLAILSHELRSPLNPILGWSRLLQTRQLDAAKTSKALATIERNAKLQTQLIDDLLDVARILRGKLEIKNTAIDLASIITAAMDVVRTSVEAKSMVMQAALGDGCLVRGDSARLQQVIWNLLSNAVKFTPQGGQIAIRLEQRPDCAQVTIADTGKGISPVFLPRLFDSFRQEDVSITRQYGGLGLGLSIVKYLVEAHGGSIVADSPGEGQGATFTLQLPLLKTAPSLPAPAPHAAALDLAGIKVLTVDDSEDSRDLLATVLEQYGAEVKVATSGQEVLAQLASFAPHVLVCDIGMPDLDGYTLLQQIRALPPEQGGRVPAIALTAYAQTDDRQRALDSGFQRHIPKPVETATLLSAIAQLTRRADHRADRREAEAEG
ncbi:PAS domain S-box protein [Nodosilinea sp. PGN35]|uniref:PAS domain S-box protein n=1 Tax=Nodosilinea sp. PGN35 TaxID=3020489 RepID=UPI0023B2F2D6|nr:PAS domain S-box protein [Nodosilinea sp. TSF1-S3]MDF0367912.1 PAS domain S-box protein [Nodosilinea sp. TSF1-S3]